MNSYGNFEFFCRILNNFILVLYWELWGFVQLEHGNSGINTLRAFLESKKYSLENFQEIFILTQEMTFLI